MMLNTQSERHDFVPKSPHEVAVYLLQCHRESLEQGGKGISLHLDVDGTLLPFKNDPEEVRAAEFAGFTEQLAHAKTLLRGAVSVNTARSLEALDRVFSKIGKEESGLILPGSFEHGATVRLTDGKVLKTATFSYINEVEASIREKIKTLPGFELERKEASLVIHWRKAVSERLASDKQCDKAGESITQDILDWHRTALTNFDESQALNYHKGSCVIEITPKNTVGNVKLSKGQGFLTMMSQECFTGTRPVAAGDSPDSDGPFLHTAEDIGGISIGVGRRSVQGPRIPGQIVRNPAEFREMLGLFVQGLQQN